jgi:hypothetical protein
VKRLCVTGPVHDAAPKIEAVLATFQVDCITHCTTNFGYVFNSLVIHALKCEISVWKEYKILLHMFLS